MKNSFKKTLIISPHADDELFTFGLLYSKENFFKEIDLLLIGYDKDRRKESLISAKINNLNVIDLPPHIKCKDCFYHLHFKNIKAYFSKYLVNYDLILSPLIEGGHQDHDTVTAALLKCKEKIGLNSKILLYPSYRSMKKFPNLYRCGIPRDLFNNQRYSFTFTFKCFKKFIKTLILAYKSQYYTWILLFPFLLIAYISRELNSMVIVDNLSFKDILKNSPKKPLFETYRSLKKSSWLKYIQY